MDGELCHVSGCVLGELKDICRGISLSVHDRGRNFSWQRHPVIAKRIAGDISVVTGARLGGARWAGASSAAELGVLAQPLAGAARR